MKAIIYHKKAAHNKFRLEKVDQPVPKENEVLVKVVSASINAADYRSLKMGLVPKQKILGSAIAGIVVSVGKDIMQFNPGDAVIADLADSGFGGLAEFAIAPVKAIALKPANTSFEDAVTLPVAATTALAALRDKAQIQNEQRVLIVGSSGGVGSYAVQLAKHFGAHVTAVCSSKKVAHSLSLGADELIDYTQEDFMKGGQRYDFILAVNGNYSLLGYRRILQSRGTYVMVGGSMGQIFMSIFFGWVLSLGGKKMTFLSAKANAKDLDFVARLMEQGAIKANIEKRFALEDTASAFEFDSRGHARGKVVVQVAKVENT